MLNQVHHNDPVLRHWELNAARPNSPLWNKELLNHGSEQTMSYVYLESGYALEEWGSVLETEQSMQPALYPFTFTYKIFRAMPIISS